MKRNAIFLSATFSWALFSAPIKVVTTTTDLAWVAKQIGKDRVEITALLKGTENPHFIDAVPDYIRVVADANVVCQIGLDLEVGWMPKVLTRSGNASVQPGGRGFCETGRGVAVLEKPTGGVDRSMGDIHPSGNPHFWISPDALAQASLVVRDTLIANDPEQAPSYQKNYKELATLLNTVKTRNVAKLTPLLKDLNGPILIEYHKEFAYFLTAFGLKSWGSIEEKPGVTPSAGRLAEVATATKAAGVRFVLAAETAPKKTVSKFSELSGLPVVTVPLSIHRSGKPSEYPELIDSMVDAVVEALKVRKG